MAMLQKMYNSGAMDRELMDLPGFRFYPTEEELVDVYLKKRVEGRYPLSFDRIIPTLDLYRYDPWELPCLDYDAGLRQWFFFVPRNHEKTCSRPNRLTASGYWKATGSDRAVRNKVLHCIGLKKTLVFYKGKGPRGVKTDWIMNEYGLSDFSSSTATKKMDMVLCRIYRKAVSHKSMEQRAKSDQLEKEERVVSVRDEYPEKSHSVTINGSCRLSNPVRETTISSCRYKDQEGICSSCAREASNESSLFDCLEPLMFDEETMVLNTPKARKRPPQLELPKLSMDCLFSQPITAPFALLSTHRHSRFHYFK